MTWYPATDRVVIVMDEVAAGHDDPDIDSVCAPRSIGLDLTADLPLRVAIRPSGEFTTWCWRSITSPPTDGRCACWPVT